MIFFIVLHYNNEELTNQCITSIQETVNDARVLVVDNNSNIPYDSARYGVDVVRNDNNGFVSGMNLGLKEALECDPEYIVPMNNDVICLEGWLDPLVKEMEENPHTGICGGKQWTRNKTFHRSVGKDLSGGNLCVNSPNERTKVVWFLGSIMMIRTKMLVEIGLHDERFTTVCSDIDHCLTARDRGWDVVFVPESNVIHIGSASYGDKHPDTQEDGVSLIQKWYGVKTATLYKDFPIDIKKDEYWEIDLIKKVNGKERTLRI